MGRGCTTAVRGTTTRGCSGSLRRIPLRFGAGDVNLHAYVGNAPADLIDPTGKIPAALVLPLAGCLGGAAGAALRIPLQYGRKPTLPELLEGCLFGVPFGLPSAAPLIRALGPGVAPLLRPLLPGLGPAAGAGAGAGAEQGGSTAAAEAGSRALDAILSNPELFKRFINHKFPANNPYSAADAAKIWQKLVEMGMNPRLDPAQGYGAWRGPHINVPGTSIHIPVASAFRP